MTTHYVPHGGLEVMPGPFKCAQARIHLFALPANPGKLQSLCDRCLNEPSGNTMHFVPDVDFIIVSFQSIAAVSSESSAIGNSGTYSQHEAATWVRVRDEKDPNGHGMSLVPYIFTDNPILVATGREVYGFPKEHAEVAIDEMRSEFSVQALSLDTPQAPASVRKLMTCRPTFGFTNFTAFSSLEVSKGNVVDELFRAGFVQSLAGKFGLILDLLRRRLDFVFLKQFRAVADNGDCEFQAVTAATQETTKLRGFEFDLTPFTLTFAQLHSHRIAEDLGVPVNADGEIQSIASGRVDVDFRLLNGRRL